ncbi:MAG: IS200/IS605 family accessory protein TnpB-related protein [Erysipelotrichaceae bacterium]|nr:IS200/IS605 family accessory protein TnpB-related protein [Erysipelotrichaceae bacterium]
MKTTITIPSYRLYVDEIKIDKNVKESIDKTFYQFNIMLEWAYNSLYDEKILGKEFDDTLTQRIKNEYNRRYDGTLKDYFVTSIYSRANGLLSSQKELIKEDRKDIGARIKNCKNQIKTRYEKPLAKKFEIKKLLVKRSKAIKNNKKFNDKRFNKYNVTIDTVDDNTVVYYHGKYNRLFHKNIYDYEVMLDKQIRDHKAKIKQINGKIKRLNEKLDKMKVPKRATFGSRKFYRLKDTTDMTKKQLAQWHKERDRRRFNTVYYSGRSTSKDGNFQCKYDPCSDTVKISLIDDTTVVFNNVVFPYRGIELKEYRMNPKHKSVCYVFERHFDGHNREYYIIKATITITKADVKFNVENGVISVDLNWDHLAWSELNREGCRIDGGVIYYNLGDYPYIREQAKSKMGQVSKQIIQICKERGKPLAMEELSFKNNDLEYGYKKANYKITTFAYRQMSELLAGQAFQNDIAIKKVDPAYTSFLGRIKYMRVLGISVHEAASYVIGRRAMGHTERLPKYIRDVLKKLKPVKNQKSFAFYHSLNRKFKPKYICNPMLWYREIHLDRWKDLDKIVNEYLVA